MAMSCSLLGYFASSFWKGSKETESHQIVLDLGWEISGEDHI